MATSSIGRFLLPLRIPPEVQKGGQAPPHDPHCFTGPELTHVAPRSGWGSDPHGPIYYKGRYHLFYQACHVSCQWWWGLHWEHCVSEDLVNWVRLPPAIMPTPGWLDADGCFTGNIKVDPKTGVPTLFYTGARLRHNPAAAERHPDPPLSACNPLMLHWETQLCAVADPNDELLVHWTKVAAPWMELPHCAYLTAWRDPFFVPPQLDPGTGQPLPGQENRLQVPPAIARTPAVPAAVAAGNEQGGNSTGTDKAVPAAGCKDGQASQGGGGGTQVEAGAQAGGPQQSLPGLQATGEGGPQVLKDNDGFVMIIGSGHEGVGGTALVYRSKDLHKGWRFDGYLCTWPNLQTGLCWECPHLLNLPDLPEGLHSLVCRTAPSFLPSTDPSAVAAKRARQQELVAKAAQAMEQAALEVARKGIAAQILQEAERAQAEHEAAAAAARAEAKRATVAAAAASSAGGAVKAQAEQEAAWAAKQEEQETSAAHRDAALATAAATIGTGAPLTEAISPTLSLAIVSARERFGEVCNEGGAATTMEAAVHEAAARAAQEAQQPAPMPAREASGQTQQVAGVVQQAAAAAAAGQERGAAPQEAPAEPQPEEPSPYAMLASGLLHTLPGDQPTIGPAQTFLLSSLFQEGADEEQQQPVGSSSQLGVDPAMLAARLMEEKLEGADDVSGSKAGAAPQPHPESPSATHTPPARDSSHSHASNPLFTAMRQEVADFQEKQRRRGADPHARAVPVVLKKQAASPKRRQVSADRLASHPLSPFSSPTTSQPASPTTPSPPDSPFRAVATPFTSTPPPAAETAVAQALGGALADRSLPPAVPAHLPAAGAAAPDNAEPELCRAPTLSTSLPAIPESSAAALSSAAAPSTPLCPTPPLLLPQPDAAVTYPQLAGKVPRPGAPEPPPTPPKALVSATGSLPAMAPLTQVLSSAAAAMQPPAPAAIPEEAALADVGAPAMAGAASLPALRTSLERNPTLASAASAALAPMREQYSRKMASIASATMMAADVLAQQRAQGQVPAVREPEEAEQGEVATATLRTSLERARTAIRDATAAPEAMKTVVEASMAGLGLPGVLSTSQLEGSQSPLELASSIQAMITAGVQQQQQRLQAAGEGAEEPRQQLPQQIQQQEVPCQELAGTAAASPEVEAEHETGLAHAITLGQKKAKQDVLEMLEGQTERPGLQAPAQGVLATTPHRDARQGGETMPAAQGALPEPPLFHGETKPSIQEIRAACRAYAEAAAAAQGFDLGMPSPDSRVVRQVAEGPPPVPEPAKPGQRWLLGLAPDAATYGIIYFLGNYSNGRFDLEGSTGPYKLDIGNVLYAPVAFYDQKAGRLLVWGYLKELWQLSPPPAMCNKFANSGGVSLPRALYLKAGKLHQVPIPEMSELRQEGKCFSVYNTQLQPEAPLLVPGPEAANGIECGDHMDIELVIRRGSAARTSLLLDSWRPKGRGAAALVFDWTTKQLRVVYKAHMRTEQWCSAAMADARAKAEAAAAARDEGTHWAQDPVGLLSSSKNPSLEGGKHTIRDEDGACYDIFTDAKCPPVPDMNPAVPDWIRMDRGRAGGALDMQEGDPLELRIFVDGSAVEVFTGTGQVLSTRVYRGAPAFSGKVDSGMAGSKGSSRTQPFTQSLPGQSGSRLQLLSVGGTCEIERAEFHETRSIWLRGQADAPLPPPVTPEALELWKADARRAANFAEEAAHAVEKEVENSVNKS